MSRPHQIFSLHTIFEFGKHTGKTLVQVIRTDPGYIRWGISQQPDEITNETADYVIAIDNNAMNFLERMYPNLLSSYVKEFNSCNYNRLSKGSEPIKLSDFLSLIKVRN
ncbi:MAG: hypothetical protein AB7G44_02730 [Bacteroidia bacterium]